MSSRVNLVKAFRYPSRLYQSSSVLQSFFLGSNNVYIHHNARACYSTLSQRMSKPAFIRCISTTSYLATGNGSNQKSEDSKGASNLENVDSQPLLESWYYEVCSRGSLTAKLPFHTIIKPLNPQLYPDMNKVILQLHFDLGQSSEVPTPLQLSEISDLYNLQVDFDSDKANMNISCDVAPGVSLPVICTFEVPLHFDVKVKMSDEADISVEGLESNSINVEVQKGNCNFKGLRCGSVSAVSESGNIISSSTLLGNVYFHTGKSGSIETGKLQGSNLSCETAMGPISVKSLYTGSAVFRSDAGDFNLGHCHGQLCIQAQQSNLNIESLEGDLDASIQTGSINAHITKHTKVDVELSTGDITFSFPEGVATRLNLDSPNVIVDESVQASLNSKSQPHHMEGYIGHTKSAQLNARTLLGTIHIKQLDWIQTTKLASLMRDENNT